ncbi:hypothetical protein L9F63_004473, partial [Diploptera punctata]
MFIVLAALCCSVLLVTVSCGVKPVRIYKFPQGFKFGAGTSAFQIEGAWNEDGKSASMWDTMFQTKKDLTYDGSTADVACDSYHKYKEDVNLLKQLGVDVYRFSIAWTRILPTGYANFVNQAGIDYYNKLIDELIANNIQPMVTMHHLDIPQPLFDIGGWANPVTTEYFEDYAKVLFTYFGDRVKLWITINEPNMLALVHETSVGKYRAAKNTLTAHARVFHLYNKEFRAAQQGKIGITMSSAWCEPQYRTKEYIQACERLEMFELDLYAHPIFSKEGDYPALVKEIVANNSAARGFRRSRLPALSRQEITHIQGTYDFFGLNHYSTIIGTPTDASSEISLFAEDVRASKWRDPEWHQTTYWIS